MSLLRTRPQGGFTLIELMIAMVIGLFLLIGIYNVFMSARQTFDLQKKLAQLQEDQRIANTMINDVIQSAGYFPNPTAALPTTAFPVAGSYKAGQSIFGTHTSFTAPDTLEIRFVAPATQQPTMNCKGGTSDVGLVVNKFTVNGSKELLCTVGAGTPQPIVGGAEAGQGLTNLQLVYGIDTNADSSVDTYMTADQVTTSTNWNNVVAIRYELTFLNPLSGQPGQPATFVSRRTVAIMNRT